MKIRKILGLLGAALSPAIFGFVVLSTLGVYVKEQTSAGFYGVVKLRSYFECGTGRLPDPNNPLDRGDPFVITRPRHLYNLSRLQGLGVFGTPTYFQLGKVGLDSNHPDDPYCYTSDSGTETAPYLDMNPETNSNWNKNRINAIGSEAFPFYGVFDGQNVEIKDLNVYADPQDAGLFGYTAHDSVVKNLFLSNITINSLGYDEAHKELYGKTEEIIEGSPVQTDLLEKLEPSLELKQGNTTLATYLPTTTGTPDGAKVDFTVGDWASSTSFVGDPSAPMLSYYIGTTKSYKDNYRYRLLCSGDLVGLSGDNAVVDLEELLNFFKNKREDNHYPIRAASTVSIIASTTDSDGLDHSRVLMAMDFNFTLQNSESNIIEMRPVVAADHGNNIGFVIGHCDGSVSDCYVHNGSFQMNKMNGYYPLAHHSGLGLIGLVGNTVHNIAADGDSANTGDGKSIGYLDFTRIYDAIVTNNTFTNTTTISTSSESPAITYFPNLDAKVYLDFLRNNGTNYVTQAINMVSFKQKRVVQTDELGVFTIATDYQDTGNALDAVAHTKNSTVKKEDTDVNGSYYVYYATGEYDKERANELGLSFADYSSSFNSDNPSQLFVGHYLPTSTELTASSMSKRELHQNYFFRFKLDDRSGGGLYFSDVDKDTAGGSFVSKYFSNKLVDSSGAVNIPVNDPRCGVMLRYKDGLETKEIDSFHASFATPNYSNGHNFYCIAEEKYNYPVANMVNFSVTTEQANVTVVAAPNTPNRGAILGVYRYGDDINDYQYYTNNKQEITKKYNTPDYAFFMPQDSHLSYFDYKVCAVNDAKQAIPDNAADANHPIKGRIGKYNWDGSVFTEANYATFATTPKLHGYGTEFGKRNDNKRLFAHTFKLPKGRYCLGSATGSSDPYDTAKIYYVCAQGQEEGDFDFDTNVYASSDKVEKIDFLKRDRFGENSEITFNTVTTYNPNGTDLENQRCYVLLSQNNTSEFEGIASDLSFTYDSQSGKFKITSTTEPAMTKVIVDNFGKEYADNRYIDDVLRPISGLENMTIQLITETDQTGNVIPYYYAAP